VATEDDLKAIDKEIKAIVNEAPNSPRKARSRTWSELWTDVSGGGRLMAIEILMPALSPTMEEGTLAKWLVKEGDTVKSGDILAEIETDKATMEFEAVDEGTVGQDPGPEGTEGVKVGTRSR
jgi:biotin carboxyl carrier protein